MAALKGEGLYDRVSPKFVLGENISQASSFVASGAAEAGIIALSLAFSTNLKTAGRFYEIPVTEYPFIEQACVILKSSTRKDAARAFLNYVNTHRGTASGLRLRCSECPRKHKVMHVHEISRVKDAEVRDVD